MAGRNTRNTKAVNTDGSFHDIECTGKGFSGNGCLNLVPTWLPKKIPKDFATLQFYCGYCTAKTIQEQNAKIESLIQSNSQLAERVTEVETEDNATPPFPESVNQAITLDNIKQETFQKVIRITSVPETQNEDLVAEVVKIAAAMNVTLRRDEVVKVYRSGARSRIHDNTEDDVSENTPDPAYGNHLVNGAVGPLSSGLGRNHQNELEDIATDPSTATTRSNRRPARSIVVELNSLDAKIRMLVSKKKLKNSSDYTNVYVRGELTYLRWKLYYYLRELETTDTVYCKKGKLFVTMKDKTAYRTEICIESVKDFHKIGIGAVDFDILGFPSSE